MQPTLRFLEAVLPANGTRVAAYRPASWPPEKRGMLHKFLTTDEALAQFTSDMDANGATVYYALATYRDPEAGRTAANTIELQALWLDIDSKHYPVKADIPADIKRVAKIIGDPTYIVSSGGGVHVYWALRRPMTTTEWRPMALAFQAMWQGLGVKADPISADPARILRLPGTHNRKPEYGEPRPVVIGLHNDVTYDPAKIIERVGTVALPSRPVATPGARDINDDLGAGIEHRPSFIGPLIKKCRQMQHIYAQRATLDEGTWYAALQLARHLEDGRSVGHLLSMGHPGYSKDEVNERLDRLEAGDIGPTTCAHFKMKNPAGCEGCEFNITSPIVLGRKELEAEPVVVDTEVHTVNEAGEVVTVLQEEVADVQLPKPYTYSGGVMYVPKIDPETKMKVDAPVFNGLLYVERVSLDSADHQQMQLYVKTAGQLARHVTLPGSAKSDKRNMATALATRGIQFMNNDASDILKMLDAMMTAVRAKQHDGVTSEQMGWQDGDKAFVVGSTAYRPNMPPQYDIPVAPASRHVVGFYEPKGSFQAWKDTAAVYGRAGGEPWQFALCYGAAGVLLPMTALSGAVLSLYSQESGRGKSTAGEGALSWWGDPAGLMSLSKDTVNALFSKASMHKNLPIMVDEVTDKPIWELHDVVYSMTQGREKARLNSDSSNRVTKPAWALPVIMTSNNSVKSRLQVKRGDAQGLFARIMEVPMDLPFAVSMGSTDSLMLRTGFKRNFGHAGPVLVKYVMENRDTCTSILDAATARLVADVGTSQDMRFWVASCAATLTVATVARTLGLFSYDVAAMHRWSVGMITQQELDAAATIPECSDILAQFLEQNANRLLVEKKRRMANGVEESVLLPEDGIRGNQLVGRVEKPNGVMYISMAAFMRFCHDGGFDLGAFIRNASAKSAENEAPLLLSVTPAKVNLGRGTTIASARTRALQFNLNHPSLLEFAAGIDGKLETPPSLRSVK